MITKLLEKTGIKTNMKVARFANRLRYHNQEKNRQQLYQNLFASSPPRFSMLRGWAFDASQSLPRLSKCITEAKAIVGENRTHQSHKGFMGNILQDGDLMAYPELIKFAVSPELISITSHYLQQIPVLSSIKLLHSIPFAKLPTSSQMYHLDADLKPQVKVFVLLHEVTQEHGPFTFIDCTKSAAIAESINYGSIRAEIRIPDDIVNHHIQSTDIHQALGPTGTVLFVDTGNCLHYGSRHIKKDRYLLQYQFSPIIRTDFRHPVNFKPFLPKNADDLTKAVLSLNFPG